MVRQGKWSQFSAQLDELVDRARVSDTELARRVGVSRLTIYRWRHGERPEEATIERLKRGLLWVDAHGVVRELEDAEVLSLKLAAGYVPDVAPQQEADRVESTDRAIVYSLKYSPKAFPSKWGRRVAELEQVVDGTMDVMWNGLPSVTRPPEYWELLAERHPYPYDRDRIEASMPTSAARQMALLNRLEKYDVRHLYVRPRVEAYLAGDALSRQFVEVPRPILRRQLGNILSWMEDYLTRFHVHVRETDVPGNITLLGRRVVLIDLSYVKSVMYAENVQGVEIVGPGACSQFTQQFDAIWADQKTMRERDEVIAWLNHLMELHC